MLHYVKQLLPMLSFGKQSRMLKTTIFLTESLKAIANFDPIYSLQGFSNDGAHR
jgi:hypothetical protein